MGPRWLTAFLDRPADSFETAVQFWTTVTGSSLSAARGVHDEFATLLPPDGDAYLRVQRLQDGPPGSHLDVHVNDLGAFAAAAVEAGASEDARHDDVVVLRSPAGLPWCVVEHHGERTRPAAQRTADAGAVHLVDQLCIDIPPSRYDQECAFWSRVTGWQLRRSSTASEFSHLVRPGWCPLRLLLQRRFDEGPARAHLDLASSDVALAANHHVRLGASVEAVYENWTVLKDPSGAAYCITARDPAGQ